MSDCLNTERLFKVQPAMPTLRGGEWIPSSLLTLALQLIPPFDRVSLFTSPLPSLPLPSFPHPCLSLSLSCVFCVSSTPFDELVLAFSPTLILPIHPLCCSIPSSRTSPHLSLLALQVDPKHKSLSPLSIHLLSASIYQLSI